MTMPYYLPAESRTSSPIKIPRDETFTSNIKGIYPCGEGAGYAGGIMTSAIDGIKVAENIIKNIHTKLKLCFNFKKQSFFNFLTFHQNYLHLFLLY